MLSILVAIACLCVLGGTAAAFTLENDGNRTEFMVHSLRICEIEEDDVWFDRQDGAENWCCVLIEATASTWNFSPYTYSVDAFSVKTPGLLSAEENAFVVLEEALSYSRAKPQEFTLRVYLHIPPDIAAAELVGKLSFTADGSTKALGAIKEEMKMYLPKLDMAKQKNYSIIDETKPAIEESSAGFFLTYFSQ